MEGRDVTGDMFFEEAIAELVTFYLWLFLTATLSWAASTTWISKAKEQVVAVWKRCENQDDLFLFLNVFLTGVCHSDRNWTNSKGTHSCYYFISRPQTYKIIWYDISYNIIYQEVDADWK